jgi:hypothetical protein
MQFKVLKESWPNVQGAIEDLEKERKVIVQRTTGTSGREGQIRVVYWNEDYSPPVEPGTVITLCFLRVLSG